MSAPPPSRTTGLGSGLRFATVLNRTNARDANKGKGFDS
jgi:hypothetical protein